MGIYSKENGTAGGYNEWEYSESVRFVKFEQPNQNLNKQIQTDGMECLRFAINP